MTNLPATQETTGMTDRNIPSKERLSHRLLNIAGDLSEIASNPPNEMDSRAMARIASQLIALAGQVGLGEDIDPTRSAAETSGDWEKEARLTLDKLAAFLQCKNVPYAVDWRDWIDNAIRVLPAYSPEKAAAPRYETICGTCRQEHRLGTYYNHNFVARTAEKTSVPKEE